MPEGKLRMLMLLHALYNIAPIPKPIEFTCEHDVEIYVDRYEPV